jgi:hypothetical protein
MRKQLDLSTTPQVLRSAFVLVSLAAFAGNVFCQTPTPTATPTATATAACPRPTPGICTSYEAESDNNTLGGSAFILDCPTCSNGLKVGYVGSDDGTLQFNGVGVVATGNYSLTICYLNGDAVRYAYLSVNGGPGTPLSFPSTGSFQTLGSIQITVTLNTGCNTLEFYNPIVGNWAPDFDRIQFNCQTCTVPSPTPVPSPMPSPTPTPTPTATPTPDGCYPNFTTAEGCDALSFLSTGIGNTGLGWRALFANTIETFNTAIGAGALALNDADFNTAVGAAALLLNVAGTQNTAVGTQALASNGSGDSSTGILNGEANTDLGSANSNTAVGYFVLVNNRTGDSNTAVGWEALKANVDGINNVALATLPLSSNTTGNGNTAIGHLALQNSVSTSDHVAVGSLAGSAITTADNNIIIGHHTGVHTVFGQVSDRCFINNISGAPVSAATAAMVFVDSDGLLGTIPSDESAPAGSSSNGVQPQAIPNAARHAGLTLEIQNLEATISQQENQIEILTAHLKEQTAHMQKVNAWLEMNKPAAKIILNKPEAVR